MFLTKHNKKVKVTHSPNKSIRPIFNLCKLNAKQVIQNHISKEDKYTFALEELGNYLGTKNINKIEGYDVSHFSGDSAVASCVVFSKQGSQKKEYRLFNIPRELSRNDVGSLEHVIKRRVKYYSDPDLKPDVILIDGGRNQLNYVNNVIKNSDYDIKVISIVKGMNRVRATETIISTEGIIEVDKHSKAFLVLQEIRDESHRFAMRAQRNKKRKRIKKSVLDNVSGIGSVLKKRLMKEFKNINTIKKASVQELMTVRGINEKIAKVIFNELKS
jgi:excinuclease ABC subunit C